MEELSDQNYQSDQRVAEMVLASQMRKGKGPNQIKHALKKKALDRELIDDEFNDIDWFEQAYQLKERSLVILWRKILNKKQSKFGSYNIEVLIWILF